MAESARAARWIFAVAFPALLLVALFVPLAEARGDALARVDALSQVLDHSRPGSPFSDRASHVGLLFPEHLGIGGVRAAWNRVPLDISLRFARVRILDASTHNILAGERASLVSLPYAAVQSASSTALSVTATTSFVHTNTTYTRLQLENRGNTPRQVIVVLDGVLAESGNPDSEREAYLSRSRALLLSGRYRSTESRDLSRPTFWAKIVPNFNLARVDVSYGENTVLLDERNRTYQVNGNLFYRMTSAPITLEPGAAADHGFGILFALDDAQFGVNNEGLLLEPFRAPEEVVERNRRRWTTYFNRAPTPDLGDPRLDLAFDHAIQVMYANLFAGSEVFSTLREADYPLTSKFERSQLAPSEAALIAAAWTELDPEIARTTLVKVYEELGPKGELRAIAPSLSQWRTYEPQNGSDHPLVAWSAWHTYQRTLDARFLRRIYPMVQKNVGWWYETHFRPGTQLFAYETLGEMGDTWAGRTNLGDPLSTRGLYGADLNASVLSAVRSIAAMGEAIGQPYESLRWSYRADALAQTMAEKFYTEQSDCLHDMWADRRELLEEPWLRSHYVLWAGVSLPGEGNQRVLEECLLDPRQFGPSPPLPTVGRAGTFYDPDDLDNGAICPHDHFLFVRALYRNELREDAHEVSRAILDMIAGSGVFAYTYHGDTGEALGSDGLYTSTTAANFILLALERYNQPEGWAQP